MWVVRVIRSRIVLLVDLSRRSRKEAIRHGTNCIPEHCSVAEWCWCICETWSPPHCITVFRVHRRPPTSPAYHNGAFLHYKNLFNTVNTDCSFFLPKCKLTCKGVKEECASYLSKSISQLRSVTCRTGSPSVTCHPTQANTLRLYPSPTGWYSIYWPFKDGGLSKPRPRVQRATGPRLLRDSPSQRDPNTRSSER